MKPSRRRFSFGTDLRQEVEREFAAHLENAARELIEGGMPPDAAREEARRRFGDLERYRDACCEIDRRRVLARRRGERMSDLIFDLRLACRTLAKSPGFLAGAILSLALGLGANTAVFSVVYAVLLKPLPFPAPDRLVMLWEKNPEKGWTNESAAPANVLDWRRPNRFFRDITAYEIFASKVTLTGRGEPLPLQATVVTGNFFSVLGVRAALGRGFQEEETWSGSRVVVLADGFWRRQLGADPAIVGRTLMLNGRACTVVGVMPPGFAFPSPDLDLWIATGWTPADRKETWFRQAHFVYPIGRLRPGVSPEQARGYLAAVAARLEKEYPETNRRMGAGLTPLGEWIAGERRRPLLVLLAAVGMVLLVACTNLANLQLARASGRRREMAVRWALGAGRGRLLRQILTESIALSLLGGAVGLLIGSWATRLLVSLSPGDLPRAAEIGLHPAVLAFASLLALLTGVLFGLAPALSASRQASWSSRESGRGATASQRTGRFRDLLVIAEVALSTLLVLGAGLLLKSFHQIRQVDPGFAPHGVLSVGLALPGARYSKAEQALAFARELLEGARALPGVSAAALADSLPLGEEGWTGDFSIEGRPGEYGPEFHHRSVTPDYFRALGVPLLAGRGFTAADDRQAPPVALISRRIARQYFAGRDPLGARVTFGRKPTPQSKWRTIVGVVGDEKLSRLTLPAAPEIFEPYAQDPVSELQLVLRTTRTDPHRVAGPLRALVRRLDPSLPLLSVRSLDEVVARSLAPERFTLLLMAVFAGIALALAAVGIFAVISYTVAQRTRELGIHLALGAQGGQLVGQVVRRSLARVTFGIALGLAAALALSRLLHGLLFAVSATDPATFSAVALLLAWVALAASYLPARRALRIDPILSLRQE